MLGIGIGTTFRGSDGAAGYNPLTTAWIAETGESDSTIIDALNTLEQGLIDNSLSAKIDALYPMVGGNATKHKYNFMNAQDTDAAFRLTFNGGFTHSSNGILPNGVNAYANTHLNCSDELTEFKACYGKYSRTNSAPGNEFMGAFDGSVALGEWFNNYIQYNGDYGDNIGSISYTRFDGMFINRRDGDSLHVAYWNGSNVGQTTTTTSDGSANEEFYFCARNDVGTASFFNTQELAFGFIADGLTDSDCTTLNTMIDTFQTTLGRNV